MSLKNAMYVPDLSGLVFYRAQSPKDMADVGECRSKGYGKYFEQPSQCRDFRDPHAIQYLCRYAHSGQIAGCVRSVRRDVCSFELEDYVDISRWVCDHYRPAEITRLSVPRCSRSGDIKMGLWKCVFLHAIKMDITHLVVSVRRGALGDYLGLLFDRMSGVLNPFVYKKLGDQVHYALVRDLCSVRDEYRITAHPWYGYFFENTHEKIIHL